MRKNYVDDNLTIKKEIQNLIEIQAENKMKTFDEFKELKLHSFDTQKKFVKNILYQ